MICGFIRREHAVDKYDSLHPRHIIYDLIGMVYLTVGVAIEFVNKAAFKFTTVVKGLHGYLMSAQIY